MSAVIAEALEDLNNTVEQILNTATNVQSKPKAWAQLLAEFKLKPASEAQRIEAARFNHTKGALPIEVRAALMALKHKTRATLRHLKESSNSDSMEMQALEERFEGFVNEAMKIYIDSIRPVISLQSIFANAISTTQTQQKQESVNTLTCSCCGAARPSNTELKSCDYCGNPFFGQVDN